VGNKEKLKKKWNSLKPDEREEIMKVIPKYKLSKPDKQFRKNPETYLNNRSWEDELIIPEQRKNGEEVPQSSVDLTKSIYR